MQLHMSPFEILSYDTHDTCGNTPIRHQRVCSLWYAIATLVFVLFGVQLSEALTPVYESSRVLAPTQGRSLAEVSEDVSLNRHSMTVRGDKPEECLNKQTKTGKKTKITWVSSLQFSYGGVIFEEDEFHRLTQATADKIYQEKADLRAAGQQHTTNYVLAKLSFVYNPDARTTNASPVVTRVQVDPTLTASSQANEYKTASTPPVSAPTVSASAATSTNRSPYVRKALSSLHFSKCFNSGGSDSNICDLKCDGWRSVFGDDRKDFAEFLSDELEQVVKEESVGKQAYKYAHSEQSLLATLWQEALACDPSGPTGNPDHDCQLYKDFHGPLIDHLCGIEWILLDVFSVPNSVCNTCAASFANPLFAEQYTNTLKSYCQKINKPMAVDPKVVVSVSSVVRYQSAFGHISCAGLNYPAIIPDLVAYSNPITLHKLPTRPEFAAKVTSFCAKQLADRPCNL